MTTAEPLYLKPQVVFQPLIDRWYAWSHLIPPATLAMNHAKRHLPIMDSYVNAPRIHAAAGNDPQMAGGPFMRFNGVRMEEVEALAMEIRDQRSSLLELGEQIQELAVMLAQRAKGFSLDPLYAQVPEVLRGFVELVYDVQNQPSFKIIEPLLYASEYYQTSAQSLMLFEIEQDERPFVLSTPSLDRDDALHLKLPFTSRKIDILSRLKWHPKTRTEIFDSLELELEKNEVEKLDQLLTPQAPPSANTFQGSGIRWRYYGHACVMVESGGVSVMTDPLIAYRITGSGDRFSFHDLPQHIDCVLITHGHQDHLMLETLLQIRHRIGKIVVPRSGAGSLQDPSLRLILEQCGFDNVVEVQELDCIDLGPLVVRAIPFSSEHADLDVRAKMTYLVEGSGRKIYFGADSRNVEPRIYDRVSEIVGPIDTVFLGMECDGAPLPWLYGPLMMTKSKDSWRMGQSRCLSGSDSAMAMEMVRSLSPQQAFVYSMGQEPWLTFLLSIEYQADSIPIQESDKFVAWCQDKGIDSGRLIAGREEYLNAL